MGNNDKLFIAGGLVGFFIGILLGFLAGGIVLKTDLEDLKKQAIDNNAAQHNPKTGEFEWINQ